MNRAVASGLRISTTAGPGTRRWRGVVILLPMLWLIGVVVLPMLVLLKVALAQAPAADGVVNVFSWQVSLEHLRQLAEDARYSSAYINSLRMASLTTIACLLLGVPLALAIARSPRRWRGLLLFAAVLPFFTSFLLRAYAWMGFVGSAGPLDVALRVFGVDAGILAVLGSPPVILLGMVYTYLPMMVVPVYVNLVRQDVRLLEAARDLGASELHSVVSITLPLALPGMLAGCMLVFGPAVGEFIVPVLLAGAEAPMVGVVIWEAFFTAGDWPVAAALAVVLGLLLLSPMALLQARLLLPAGESRA
ncbi:MAG: ABC transporter permease [Pseudomonadota bacterium]